MQRLNRATAPAKLHIIEGRAQIDEWALLWEGIHGPARNVQLLLLLKPLGKEGGGRVLTEEDGEGGYREEPPSEGHRVPRRTAAAAALLPETAC